LTFLETQILFTEVGLDMEIIIEYIKKI